MIVRRHRMGAAAIGAVAAGILLAAGAPGQTRPPRAEHCKELTGAERARCEQRVAEEDKARRHDDRGPTDQAHASPGKKESSKDEARPAAPKSDAEESPPDTTSDSDDHSDTADPPQDRLAMP